MNSNLGKNFVSLLFSKRFGRFFGSFFLVMLIQKATLKISTITGHPIVLPGFVQFSLVIALGFFMSFLWRKLIKPFVIVSMIGLIFSIIIHALAANYKIKAFSSTNSQAGMFLIITLLGLSWLILRPLIRKWSRPFYFKTINQIDKFGNGNNKIGGTMFEDYLVSVYRQLGYNASTIAELKQKGIIKIKSVDQGADLLVEYLENNEVKVAVIQCKHYSSSVGNKAVQEAYSAMGFYGVHSAIVLTNNYFTAQAKELADKLGIMLINREGLIQLNDRAAQPKLTQMLEKTRLVA